MPLRQRLTWLTKHINLFWRTFLYVALLLVCSLFIWQQTFWWLELEPRAVQNARQIATLVTLTRAGLEHADPIARISLVKTLADQEGLYITPRERGDVYVPFSGDALSQRISRELQVQLGHDTEVARSVNGREALWVGFRMGDDRYWLLFNPQRLSLLSGRTMLIWLVGATVLSLIGAGVIAGLINLPLQRLKQATAQVYAGALDQAALDENVPTAEVRAVNQGFNRMVQQLAQMEQDRRLMLAGISHDLRTPLARLRLEAEMSVPDEQARNDMVADIEQASAIIGQFMDYARPQQIAQFMAIPLAPVLHQAATGYHHLADVVLTTDWAHDDPALSCCADPVDVLRLVNNLLENARRYGKTATPPKASLDHALPPAAMTHIHLSAKREGQYCTISVADNGMGVDEATRAQMTRPFFRADAARSQSVGAGLGLAVVEKLLHRLGGHLQLQSPAPRDTHPHHQGLCATLWLPSQGMEVRL